MSRAASTVSRSGARFAARAAALALAASTLLLHACGDGTSERLEHAARNVRTTAFGSRPTGFDPIHVGGSSEPDAIVAVNVLEPLYQYHYLRRPYEVVPCLAAAMPQVSDDGHTVRIELRDDVRFEDDPCFPGGAGRTVVADDVVFSLVRIADPANASSHWSTFEGRVVGLDAYREQRRESGVAPDLAPPAIEGLRAVDGRTVEFRLVRPWPQLVFALAHLSTAVVAREAVATYGGDLGLHPVGTGPYRLRSFDPDVRVVLERSPSYRGEPYPSDGAPGMREAGLLDDAGRTMPFFDELEFELVQSAETTWLMFLDGRLDTHGVPGHGYDQILPNGRTLAPELSERGVVLDLHHGVFTRWIGFDMTDPVVGSDLDLRRAISLALDRAEFDELFQTGRGDLPTGIVPRALLGDDSREPEPFQTHDPDRARELLERVRAAHGGELPRLSMLFAGSSAISRQIGQLVGRWLADVGLELDVHFVEEGSLRTAMRSHPHQLFFGVGYGHSYPDAEDLFRRFYGANVENGLDLCGYVDPEFDALYERARVMQPGDERDALYRAMAARLEARIPVAALLDYNWQFVHYDWLSNVVPHAFMGHAGMAKYQRIDTELRVRRTRARLGLDEAVR
ncbi:MAG: ABC transporter substrate-binding protein [Planctomycetota bacterium]